MINGVPRVDGEGVTDGVIEGVTLEDEIGIKECYFGEMIGGIYYDGEEVQNYGGVS